MIVMFTTYSGLGPLVAFGLLFIMLTETALKAAIPDPKIIAPHSWWLLIGYIVAATYCILLHFLLNRCARKLEELNIETDHRLAAIPIKYWSIFYIVFGFIRLSADK